VTIAGLILVPWKLLNETAGHSRRNRACETRLPAIMTIRNRLVQRSIGALFAMEPDCSNSARHRERDAGRTLVKCCT
jgi:hypothetical protein